MVGWLCVTGGRGEGSLMCIILMPLVMRVARRVAAVWSWLSCALQSCLLLSGSPLGSMKRQKLEFIAL